MQSIHRLLPAAVMAALLTASPSFAQGGQTPPAATDTARTYELREVDETPELRNRQGVAKAMLRNYPRELRDAGVTGSVVLRFLVQQDGTVDPRSIRPESVTHDGFVAPAAAVVRTMRFAPAKVDGERVRVWVTLPVAFALVAEQDLSDP
ncbi:MAG TPA: energy transducer TonB [Longimicrobium sp.]|nr:energy transducer TonB [Longimicrobium sp.]